VAWHDEQGRELALDRWPRGGPAGAGDLRAWDAADEYLLRRLGEAPPPADARLLLVDDRWGALACALARRRPVLWSDSHLGRLALAANLGANALPAGAVAFVPADALPAGPFDLALLRLPKDLDALADTLRRLRPLLAPQAEVVAGGMIKHTPVRAWRLLEAHLGPTVTTPGWKKARLGVVRLGAVRFGVARPDAAVAADPRPGAATAPPGYELPADGLRLQGAPGVFGGGRPDGGAALLLRHLPTTDGPLAAADLGCGDGVLALALARRCPRATVLAVDESYRAVACARANLARNFPAPDAARVDARAGDGLDGVEPASLDLVVCNPPFHQGHAVADVAAARLFAQALAALRPGGRLLVVGNRHLGHHAKLARLFGNCETLDDDGRFLVLRATRTG
jgi:23S rRNA (guanine1835-N2)-methyltransferase